MTADQTGDYGCPDCPHADASHALAPMGLDTIVAACLHCPCRSVRIR